MILTPHRVKRRYPEKRVGADLVVAGIGYGPATELDVQLTPTTSDAAYRSHMIEFERPYFLLWVGDPDDFKVGTLLEDEKGRFYIVSAPARDHNFGNAADHCDSIAELQQFSPPSVDRTSDVSASNIVDPAYKSPIPGGPG